MVHLKHDNIVEIHHSGRKPSNYLHESQTTVTLGPSAHSTANDYGALAVHKHSAKAGNTPLVTTVKSFVNSLKFRYPPFPQTCPYTRAHAHNSNQSIIAFKGAIQDFLQSPHCSANRLQHVRSSGPGAVVCKSCATHRAHITRNKSCYVPRGTKGQLS